MEKSLEVLSGELSSIRTGRATSSLIENIVCSVYGGTQQLKVVELAMIASPDPSTITVQPWDAAVLSEVKKGIEVANVGLTPIITGDLIRISVPPLSAERRQEYVQLLNRQLENGRIMIRQTRHENMAGIKKSLEAKEINEDERFRSEENLQKLTDEFVGKIDQMGKKKEEELLSV